MFICLYISERNLPHGIFLRHFGSPRGASTESKILRDRLYRSRESPNCLAALGSAPEFPFSLVQVNTSQVSAAPQATRQRQQQSFTQLQQQQQTYPQQRQAASQKAAVSQTHTEYFATQQTLPVSRLVCCFARDFHYMTFDLTPLVRFDLKSGQTEPRASCRLDRAAGPWKRTDVLCEPNHWSNDLGKAGASGVCSYGGCSGIHREARPPDQLWSRSTATSAATTTTYCQWRFEERFEKRDAIQGCFKVWGRVRDERFTSGACSTVRQCWNEVRSVK